MDRAIAFMIGLLGACVVLAFVLVLSILKVQAHEDGAMSYPLECCSGQDCAPVDKVETVSGPALASMFGPGEALPPLMVVTTRHGSVVVPANFKHRESKDGRMHACILNGRLICLFMPPAM